MSKGNGQADISLEEQLKDEQNQTLEKELPAADAADGFEEKSAIGGDPQTAAAAAGGELEKLRAERNDLFERLARLQAEFDNYRKRAAKENSEYRDYAVSDAARALLPVVDSFTLALKNAAAKPEDLRKGVELIFKQLQDVLQKLNIERVPAQGEPFDPRVHEAIEMVETDAAPDHHVLEELQPGYRIKGRLLRPAMVRVAKKVG
ncbi:MAG TPA: nucleotide exchange factor GrpE [Candidatus Angelobacter sp.]|jgi:molecular chaperone GrpE|nr:nucleotide exchange factor GrpE [Candidatus Angelobacter sp.]